MNYVHSPIMIDEICEFLISPGDRYFLDCTVGEGGHAEVILTRFSGIVVYGIDRNIDILEIARNRLSIFQDRFLGFNINYKDISTSNVNTNKQNFDSALIDLGISMFHYKQSKKGFSFSKKEKLDMRLDNHAKNVYDIINTDAEELLSDIFYNYGEERFSRIIAKKIVEYRKYNTIEFSDQLAEIISGAIPKKFHPIKIHPATKCFQALRIYANDELENIKKGIPEVLSLLRKGGKLGVITFHSIEDRIVKEIFNYMYKSCICPPEAPICNCGKKREINWINRMIKPSKREIENNPSSRSAKLRIVEKL